MPEDRLNNPKSWIAQLFCKHKNTVWCRRQTPFLNLRGERQYLMCRDCGKEIRSVFIENDY